MTRFRPLALACAVIALLPPAGGDAAGRLSHGTMLTATTPCRGLGTQPSYRHVVWIWLENHGYDAVSGSSQAPFTNQLAAACGLATNYHNITHPSLPNYIAATSGSTQGITDDCQPSECAVHAPNLFAQLRAAHLPSSSYQESMPRPCDLTAESGANPDGAYAPKHNPAVYYLPRTGCAQRNVPLGTPASGALARALASGSLPAFSFITPNLCNDTHDCPISTGDQWLSHWMRALLSSRAYRAGRTVIFITWDEGEGGGSRSCAADTRDPGCHVATIVVSPTTRRGTRSRLLFNHYALLKTTEQLLGIKTYLGHAGDRATRSMRAAFNL
jgi:phosphatidylinositol-3-phosphatase